MLTQTSKSKKSSKNTGFSVWNFGIPAGESADGFNTCPGKAQCAHGCYANQGFYVMKGSRRRTEENLVLSKKENFVYNMNIEIVNLEKILKVSKLAIRIHDSGDFYSKEYLLKWAEIAAFNSSVDFYAYTKMIPFFKGENTAKIPTNFHIIYSFGGKWDLMIDVGADRHCHVFKKQEDLINANYTDVTENDTLAYMSSNNRIGVSYHGNQFGKEWESWRAS